MKHPGSTFEYAEERNADLLQAYHDELENASYISVPEIFCNVVNRPSKRFWVSEERAAIVISSMLKGNQLLNMSPTKREMFFEIYKRVLEMYKTSPHLPFFQIIFNVIRQPAPKFYLTPGSAKVIVCKIKRQCYAQRKNRLKHTF